MLTKYKYLVYIMILVSCFLLGYIKGYTDSSSKHSKLKLIEENSVLKNTMNVITALNTKIIEANKEISDLRKIADKNQEEIIKEVVKYEKVYLEKDSDAKCVMDSDWMRIKTRAIESANNTKYPSE